VLENLSNPEEAYRVAQVLVASCAAPMTIDRIDVVVSCSVGVALHPHHAVTPERLARAADAALYRAKDVRNRWQAFAEEMDEHRPPALTVNALRQAIETRALEVYYQPVVDLQTRRMSGVEALVRWTHPQAGSVPASQIVALAEESGLIVGLGRLVLETAVAQVLAWDRLTGRTDLTVAINVSAVQVHEGSLLAVLDRVVSETGFDPRRIELEFTETGALRGSAAIDRVFRALKARGFVLTIDDFGTGYSALSRLERLPIDTIKIDRSFVQAIGTERRGGTIARAVVAIGHSLGLQVIGEGVETEQQRDFLAAAGCHRAQGYLLGHPMPAAALTAQLFADGRVA
jgi:EAL domain-containing protein (putative c-di-GMP-specific phosphodiesterase class I)